MKYYIEMWKRTFDYKGKSSRTEFWIPFAINAVLALILLVLTVLKIIFNILFYPIIIISAVLILSAIPFISLTVRRLHDTGRSGWWYCLIFGFGVGAIILLMMCASALQAFNPDANIGGCVYGPPEYYEPGNNTNAPVYGPPQEIFTEDTTIIVSEFNPETNIPSEVYGPPPIENTEYDPGENTNPVVYGPPPTESIE